MVECRSASYWQLVGGAVGDGCAGKVCSPVVGPEFFCFSKMRFAGSPHLTMGDIAALFPPSNSLKSAISAWKGFVFGF